jgi:hypothetical protein
MIITGKQDYWISTKAADYAEISDYKFCAPDGYRA